MLWKAGSCIRGGGRVKLLTPSSILLEFKDDRYEYLGMFIEWLPFDNIINLPLRFLIRPKPIVIAKIQPRRIIPGYASLVARSRDEALRGRYEIRHKGISETRLARLLEVASKYGFEKITIDVKPNVTIVTLLRGDCGKLVESIRSFVDELVGLL